MIDGLLSTQQQLQTQLAQQQQQLQMMQQRVEQQQLLHEQQLHHQKLLHEQRETQYQEEKFRLEQERRASLEQDKQHAGETREPQVQSARAAELMNSVEDPGVLTSQQLQQLLMQEQRLRSHRPWPQTLLPARWAEEATDRRQARPSVVLRQLPPRMRVPVRAPAPARARP